MVRYLPPEDFQLLQREFSQINQAIKQLQPMTLEISFNRACSTCGVSEFLRKLTASSGLRTCSIFDISILGSRNSTLPSDSPVILTRLCITKRMLLPITADVHLRMVTKETKIPQPRLELLFLQVSQMQQQCSQLCLTSGSCSTENALLACTAVCRTLLRKETWSFHTCLYSLCSIHC